MSLLKILIKREEGLPDIAWVFFSVLLINIHRNRPYCHVLRWVEINSFPRDRYIGIDIGLSAKWRLALGMLWWG
jgi:hypothetical protein